MVPERNGAGGNIVVRGLDSPVPHCDIPAHQSTSGVAVFVSHNHCPGQLDERRFEFDVCFRRNGDSAFRLNTDIAVHLSGQRMGLSVVPEFRAVFVSAVGDLLFLTGGGNCLGIRSAKVRPLLLPLPGLQDKSSLADVWQFDFLVPQNAALERLIAVRVELVGVVQLNLRLAVSLVPGFQTGCTGFEVCEVKHKWPLRRLSPFLP